MSSDDLEAALIDWYSERPVENLTDNKVLWSSAEGETWTLVEYRRDGVACTLEDGMNWDGKHILAQSSPQNYGDQ
ncbi:MAG: S-adenosyl-L-homocysteine hydrolase [Roseobacter sp.]